MSKVFVSAGVYTKEIDNTFTPPGSGAIGASFVGLTQKGPAFLPVEVGTFGEFKEIFGNMQPDLPMPYAARAYLRNSSILNVVRVLGRGTASVGHACLLAFPHAATGVSADAAVLSAGNTVLGVLRFRGTVEEVYLSGSPTNFAIAIPGKGVTASNLSLVESSNNYLKKVVGTDPINVKSGDSLTALYVDAVFDYAVGASVSGTVSGATGNSMFAPCTANSSQITGGFAPGQSPMVVSQNFGGTVYNLFQVFTRSDGNAANNDIKISITHVDTTATADPAFTVLVRDAKDTDNNPIIYEQFISVNLNPASKQYVGRVIGDRKPVYDLTQNPPEILFDGDYANASNFIRVRVEDGFPSNSRPAGFKGVGKIVPTPHIPELTYVQNHLNARSEVDNNIFLGPNFSLGGLFDRTKKTITSASASTSADTGFLIYSVTGDLTSSGSLTAYVSINMVGSNSGNFSSTNKVRFTMPMYEGWDGLDPRSDKFVDMNDGTLSADFSVAFKTLANQDEIDTNLIVAPGAHSSSVGNIPQMAIDTVSDRGDAFTIVDLSDGTATANAINLTVAAAQSEADKYDTNYGASYYPWIQINDPDNDKLIWVPPSVEVVGAFAFNDRVADPWFAPAGFNRGVLENVVNVRRRLTQSQRDDLYSRRVNPIAVFPGANAVIWGQKTLQKKASVLDRVNVRRMLLTVRKTIARFTRLFVFEGNTASMRARLLAQVNQYLSEVQHARGLTEFRAVLDETTTSQDLIDRNTVKGQIFLRPTSAAEIFIFDIALNQSGATFSE